MGNRALSGSWQGVAEDAEHGAVADEGVAAVQPAGIAE